MLGLEMPKVVDYVYRMMSPEDVRRYNETKEERTGDLKSKSVRVGLENDSAIQNWKALNDRARSLAFRDSFIQYPLKVWKERGFVRNITYDEFFSSIDDESI
jgi:hypothetical protein